MASKLSGTSSTSFKYVCGNIGQLTVVSVLPVILMVVGSLAYVLLGIDTALTGSTGEYADGPGLLYIIGAIAWGLISMIVYCWLVAKVSRLYLTGEPASVIGSGGTLKAGFWIALYYFAATLIILIPLVIGVFVIVFAGSLLFAGSQDAGSAGAVVLAALCVITVALLVGWAQCRFIVGFVPLALGERAGLFGGWRLSRGNNLGLFGRVLAATLLWTVLLVVVIVILIFALFPLLGMDITDPSAGSFQMTGYALLIQQIFFIVFALPFYWYLDVLFCETYRRLSAA